MPFIRFTLRYLYKFHFLLLSDLKKYTGFGDIEGFFISKDCIKLSY